VKVLYIPHGSDERVFFHLYLQWGFYLYIPHGSDERRVGAISALPSGLSFISHMVQMKDKSKNSALYKKLFALYPTWFR